MCLQICTETSRLTEMNKTRQLYSSINNDNIVNSGTAVSLHSVLHDFFSLAKCNAQEKARQPQDTTNRMGHVVDM